MAQPWDLSDDSELFDAVRHETQYDTDKLPKNDLEGLAQSAKRELALRAGTTSFYSDRGISVALLGLTCAKAKGAVENQAVQTKNLGTEDVTFRTSDGDSLQLQMYEDMVQRGLSNASTTSAGVQGLELTGTYYSDTSSG